MSAGARLFFFLVLLGNNFTNTFLLERFQKIESELGAVDHDAEVTRLGVTDLGARGVATGYAKYACILAH